MSFLNADIPWIECLIRDEFLYNQERGHGGMTPCIVFGVAAIEGRGLGFHVMLQNGAQWARQPLHALAWKPDAPRLDLAELQLWDVFSYHIAVHRFGFLRDLDVDVVLRSGRIAGGQYLFTVDYCRSDDSENPAQHKCHHIIRLDDGNFAAQPNNRLRWQEPSFIRPFTAKPDYRVNTTVWHAERGAPLKDDRRQFYTFTDESSPAEGQNGKETGSASAPAGSDTPPPDPRREPLAAGTSSSGDDLYDRAVAIVRSTGKCSVSHIWVQLDIPLEEAMALIDRMERDNIVGWPDADGNRMIL